MSVIVAISGGKASAWCSAHLAESPAKARASRANGKKGGRPRKDAAKYGKHGGLHEKNT